MRDIVFDIVFFDLGNPLFFGAGLTGLGVDDERSVDVDTVALGEKVEAKGAEVWEGAA